MKPLTEILRNGARSLLTQAVETEVADFLGRHVNQRRSGGDQRGEGFIVALERPNVGLFEQAV